MSKINHIYWFAPYDLTCPSTRYRGRIPLDFVREKYAVSSDFFIPERSLTGYFSFLKIFLRILFFRKKNSLIVIQKICSNGLYANAIKVLLVFKRKNTLYDLDDAEYLRQPTHSLHFFLKHCATIQVGSLALKNYCLKFNKNVSIATSPVYKHPHKKANKNPKLHIGWVGDVGNGKSISKDFAHKTSLFKILFPQIRLVKIPIKLSIIGVKNSSDIPKIMNYFSDMKNIELDIPVQLNWKNDSWLYDKIKHFDVGVSPLVNHPFNIAKSAFKAKQYLSCGVPVIASDVGENSNFILDKKNGFLVQKPAQFYTFIDLISNMSEQEYDCLIQNSLASFNNFSIENYCKVLLNIST